MAQDLFCKQRVRILDLICEGPIAGLCDESGTVLSYEDRDKGVLVDLTPIRNSDGSVAAAGVNTDFRVGTTHQSAITGFPSSEQEVAVGQKVTIASPVQRQIPAGSHNALRISLQIPALFRYDDKGARSGSELSYAIEIKLSSESEWRDISYDGTDIQGETMYPYVREYRVILEGAGPWDVRVTRLTAESEDPAKLQNELWWYSYTLIADYRLSFRHSCIGAIEMDAEQNQSIRPRARRILGMLVRVPSNYNPATRCYSGVWDGQFAGCELTLSGNYTAFSTSLAVAATAVDLPDDAEIKFTDGITVSAAYLNGAHAAGSTTLQISPIPRNIASSAEGFAYIRKFTTNPAWQWFDLATHKRYGVGAYVPEDTIDIWALYSISRYCDGVDGNGNFVGVSDGNGGVEPRFSCTAYIANAEDAYKVLADLASAFRGMIYWGAGHVIPVQDSPKTPQFSFTNANVIDGRFNYSGSARKSRHTVAYVRWNDPADYYRPKLEQVLGDPADMDRLGVREANVSAFGCTSRSQAIRAGKWLLLTEKYEQETVTFSGGLEAARCRPGSIIQIRDRNKTVNRMAGRLKALGEGTVQLDAPVVLDGAGYSLVITRDDGQLAEVAVQNGSGNYQTLSVSGSLEAISPNAVWILRSETLQPTQWRVLNIREREKHIFEISALKYVAGKFGNVEQGLDLNLPSNGDLPPVVRPNQVGDIDIEERFVKAAEKYERTLNVSWEPATGANIRGYRVEVQEPNSVWRVIMSFTTALSIKPLVVSVLGDYNFRITTLGYYDLESTGKLATYTLGEVQPPATPADFVAEGISGGFKLTWVDALKDKGYYRIYVSATTSKPSTHQATVPGGTSDYSLFGFSTPTTRSFWLEPVLNRIELPGTAAGPATTISLSLAKGDDGAPGSSVEMEYSVDGSTSWHFPYSTGDLYMRQRLQGGTWSAAIRIAGTTGSPGPRGSCSFYRSLSDTAEWSDTEADAAIAAFSLSKVLLDTVTEYKSSANFSETRYWTGSVWETVAQVIDGNLIVHGTIGSNALQASISLVTPLIVGGMLRLNGASTICADTKDGEDSSIVRVNGGGADGQGRGGQIDVLGNEYTQVTGYNGSVLLTPGSAAQGTVRLRDRTGTDRVIVHADGTIELNGDVTAKSVNIVP